MPYPCIMGGAGAIGPVTYGLAICMGGGGTICCCIAGCMPLGCGIPLP
jgi:hypothetical protein